jgi:acyl-CoA dehydrogenase
MFFVLEILIVLGGLLATAYYRPRPLVWSIVLGLLLIMATAICRHQVPNFWPIITLCWLIFLPSAIVFNLPILRQRLLSKPLMQFFRKSLPAMSSTEREALDAGDTWWEGDLFQGQPDWQKLYGYKKPSLSAEEQTFLDNQVETLCSMLDDWRIMQHDKDLPPEVWAYIKQERFFGLVAKKEYGGLEFSALAHSTIIMKIATRSISAAVTVMVPNSLGPAELLYHYGTQEQKDYYVPRLARAEEIPCFALTGPEAGSDAAAMTDTGVVCMGDYQGQRVLGIRLNWNKHYITLAPVATVLGLAFKLYDPDHLLGQQEEIGITVCLIPTAHPGVETGRRHLPLNLAFMNGPTTGTDVFIPIEWIIGGRQMAGQGWRMLMECLSIGRGVSLPAMATANAKLSYRMTSAYTQLRRQFKTPLVGFEGVEEAMARIAGFCYLLEASRTLTLTALDLGIKPSVVSAIAKYHMTELGRQVMNDAMDIHAGRGIQMGPRNYLAHSYIAIPISITVEGANILTRNLIIFGQGAVRCHPFIRAEMEAVADANQLRGLNSFDKLITSHIGYMLSNIARSFIMGLTGARFIRAPQMGTLSRYHQQITRMSTALALTADIAMSILGGDLKRKERLSARLGDVLSYLYMATAVLKYYVDQGKQPQDLAHVSWSIEYCLYQCQEAVYGFFANFPQRILATALRCLVFPWGRSYAAPSDKLSHRMVNDMLQYTTLKDRLTVSIYLPKNSSDAVGLIETALSKLVAAQPAEQKLRQHIRSGAIAKGLSLAKQLEIAEQAGFLTSEESESLRQFECLRQEVIKVDAFSKQAMDMGANPVN